MKMIDGYWVSSSSVELGGVLFNIHIVPSDQKEELTGIKIRIDICH